MVGLTFNNVGLAGLVGDIDASHVRDVTRNSPVCVGHLWRSLQRDLRADLREDLTVLSCHPEALGDKSEELFVLFLVEFHNK